jgi:transcriptional antiterminator NusG
MNMDNKNARLLVRDTPGITNFVGPLGEPVPLSRAEVARLISTTTTDQPTAVVAAAEEKSVPTVLFELGEIVKVMSGPLSDFDGEITEVNPEQQKLKVLVSIFERQVPVELPYDQVQKV